MQSKDFVCGCEWVVRLWLEITSSYMTT